MDVESFRRLKNERVERLTGRSPDRDDDGTAGRQGFSDVMSVVRAAFCGLVVGNGGRGNRRNGEGTLPPLHVHHLPSSSFSSRSFTADLLPRRSFPRRPQRRYVCFSALVRAPFTDGESRRVSLLHVKLETRAIKAYLGNARR